MILVIIPTYNEAQNIGALVKAILGINLNLAVLIVDDNSPDGTGQIADQLATQHSNRVFTLHRPAKQGLAPAYIAGLNWALQSRQVTSEVTYVVTIDADWSHDPDDIPRLVGKMEKLPADVVIGSRYIDGGKVEGWARHRRILSRLGNWYARFMTQLPVKDTTSGFQCYRRNVLKQIDLDNIQSNGYVFLIELKLRAWQAGFSLAETPITFRERRAGQTKMNWKIALEALWRIPLLKAKTKKRS